MKFTRISSEIQKRLLNEIETYGPLMDIVQAIHAVGGRPLLVGGAVRDLLLKLPIKDLDIEVHGCEPAQLESVLRRFGYVDLVGKAFGVYRVHGIDADFSMPRKDEPGRKPVVAIDPFMSLKEAFERRDLTMNAMGIDLISFELIDPFNGQEDLKQHILKAPNIHFFTEDPLRFYRVMQFVGRFDMEPDAQLNDVCKTMDLSHVSIERIETEFEKLLLKSRRPSRGIRWLLEIGRLKTLFPELGALVGVKQDPRWHPEGDVFEHTMQTVDAAAQLPYENEQDKLIIMYAALCHDLGKVTTTVVNEEGIISHGHEQEGVALTQALLARITGKKDLIKQVCLLVKYHMAPAQFVNDGAKAPAYKRLARKLAPSLNLIMLAKLAIADKRGRNPAGDEPLKSNMQEIDEFLKRAQLAKVEHQMEKPVLMGRDLLEVVSPGPQLGDLLERAYEIQIEEGIYDKEELKKRVLNKVAI